MDFYGRTLWSNCMGYRIRVLSIVSGLTKLTMCFQSIKCATDVRPPLKNAILIINKEMKRMLNWIKKECWLAFMLVAIALLTWAVSQGESFVGHIPLACILLIIGVGMESSNERKN